MQLDTVLHVAYTHT